MPRITSPLTKNAIRLALQNLLRPDELTEILCNSEGNQFTFKATENGGLLELQLDFDPIDEVETISIQAERKAEG